jgi:hypothetical protein
MVDNSEQKCLVFCASTAPHMRTIIKINLHTGIEHSMFDACMKSFNIIVLMCLAVDARKPDIF